MQLDISRDDIKHAIQYGRHGTQDEAKLERLTDKVENANIDTLELTIWLVKSALGDY